VFDPTPICRAMAGLADGGDPVRPSDLTAQAAVRWLQRNKQPLLAVADRAPTWLTDDPAFSSALVEEREWYETSRREYALVHAEWLKRGIPSLMIKSAGNAPSFPHTSDNLDILVRPEQGVAARDALRWLGYVELRNIEEPQKFLFRKFVGGRCVSAIHVHERVAWFVGFLDEAALWERRRVSADDPLIEVPSPEDALLINLAHACYENKRLKLQEVVRLRHALRTAGRAFDWAYCEHVAAARGWLDGLACLVVLFAGVERALYGDSLVPEAQVARFETIAARHGFIRRWLAEIRRPALELPLDLSYPFCKKLYYRKILADPAVPVRERWRDVVQTLLWGIKLKSGIRPQPGVIISLSGADGSGKTAHAEALVEALRLCEIKTTYFWNRGGSTGLLRLASRLRRTQSGRDGKGAATAGGGHQPGDDTLERRRRRLANPAARLLWSWLVAFDQIGAYWLRAWLPARLGRVVVVDRYAYDTAVEMDASLPADARWSRLAIQAMLALTPRPAFAYVLDSLSQTARLRKPDEPWHAAREQERRDYLALARRLDLRTLSTEGAFAESNDPLIREVMVGYMAGFETWLNGLFMANPSQKNAPDVVWARGGAR
jgi:thymidylate kinase